jgi:hypothetical protein
MKTMVLALIISLAMVSLAFTRPMSGPNASGTYRFGLAGDATAQLEFDAQADERGVTTGRMTFTDTVTLLEGEPDDTGWRNEGEPSGFLLSADFDSLTVENNRALMAGVVRDSSNRSYIGRWVQLVVEDNGDDPERPDKFMWRICQPAASGWTPQDSEDPRDEGVTMHWWATDAEREDDKGVASPNLMPGSTPGCPRHSLSSYRFPTVTGEGSIQVSQ